MSDINTHVVKGITFELPPQYKGPKHIGNGTYGTVISALDTGSDSKVAVKKIRELFRSVDDAKRVYREVRLMQFLDHPCILKLLSLHKNPGPERPLLSSVYLVSPLMAASLKQLKNLTEEHHKYYVYQLLCGLNYMHSAGVVHRDFTPANLLTDYSCNLKIADFGLARGVQVNAEMTDYVVARHYRAPELILEIRNYTPAVDIWAAGCVFAFLVNGSRVLFPGNDALDQIERIFKVIGTPDISDFQIIKNGTIRSYLETRMTKYPTVGLREKIPGLSSDEAADFLAQMLTFNPAKRPTAAQLLQHPYLASSRVPELEKVATEQFVWAEEGQNLTVDQMSDLFLEELRKFGQADAASPAPVSPMQCDSPEPGSAATAEAAAAAPAAGAGSAGAAPAAGTPAAPTVVAAAAAAAGAPEPGSPVTPCITPAHTAAAAAAQAMGTATVPMDDNDASIQDTIAAQTSDEPPPAKRPCPGDAAPAADTAA